MNVPCSPVGLSGEAPSRTFRNAVLSLAVPNVPRPLGHTGSAAAAAFVALFLPETMGASSVSGVAESPPLGHGGGSKGSPPRPSGGRGGASSSPGADCEDVPLPPRSAHLAVTLPRVGSRIGMGIELNWNCGVPMRGHHLSPPGTFLALDGSPFPGL